MTWLDAVVVVVLLLAALGGYTQGLVRGLAHLGGLLAILVLSGGVMLQFADQATATSTLAWTLGGMALVLVLVTAVVWSVLRAVPQTIHRQRWNRLLGIVPALAQALVIIALILTLAEQLAPTQATQELIQNGSLTGPLLLPFEYLEQALLAG